MNIFDKLGVGVTIGSIVEVLTQHADLMNVLCVFMLLDFITGYAKGFINHNLSSEASLCGIIKKILIICVCVMAHEVALISDSDAVELLVLYFFIANEGLSILENSGACGVPIPSRLSRALEQLKGDD